MLKLRSGNHSTHLRFARVSRPDLYLSLATSNIHGDGLLTLHLVRRAESFTEVNSHGPYKLKVCGLSQRLVSGAAVFTERIGVLEEKQLRLPCAKMLLQHCPSNTKTFEFKPGELPEVLSAFVVPLSQAGMVIDHEVASCMISLVRLCESSVAQVPCERDRS